MVEVREDQRRLARPRATVMRLRGGAVVTPIERRVEVRPDCTAAWFDAILSCA
jgi:hypothetical protein